MTVEQICDEFRAAWVKRERPSLVAYLHKVDASLREELLGHLVEIDIEHRIFAGEMPVANDYLKLGLPAFEVAKIDLEHSFINGESGDETDESFQTEDDDESISIQLKTRPSSNRKSSGLKGRPQKFVGPYRLIKKIGTGGMGTVWLAEQEVPVRRRVALKLIRSDIDYKGAIARFEAERQAIALMDHQNIARILDAGTTENGSPYFVMELIEGIRLNKYCDLEKLTLRKRLELMLPVCRAIQHAHQKGILHRDLKHSNVLVTVRDGKPVPKVIDFGLAKALEHQQRLTDKTMYTEIGKVVGTLQYMSPEQAETGNIDVDTRSDIYSLGVMIYKLLTGSTPLGNEGVSGRSLALILEDIRESDPARPSQRLSEKTDLNIIAERAGTNPDKLLQTVRGDLDWIVLKAIEKDRERRYETADALATDIERYLNFEEVVARPPSTGYRLQKFVMRNQRLVASMLICTLLLLAGITGTSLGFRWALNERDRANAKTTEASNLAANAIAAEKVARESELHRMRLQRTAESQLHAVRMKSAWSDWQLGNSESAWRILNEMAKEDQGWESRFLRNEFSSQASTLFGHAHEVNSLSVSPNGKWLVSGSRDNTIKVWEARSLKLVRTHYVDGAVNSVAISNDSKWLAYTGLSNRVVVLSLVTGDERRRFGPFESDGKVVRFLTNKKLVLGLSTADKIHELRKQSPDTFAAKILILPLEPDQAVQELIGHTKDLTDIACSKDGQTILSSSLDNRIVVWNKADSGFEQSDVIEQHVGPVNGLAISPDQALFASCGEDKSIRLWEMGTNRQFRTIFGHTQRVNSVAFSDDGQCLVSSSEDGTAKIWNLKGKLIRLCQGHFAETVDAKFSKDNKRVFTASNDHTVGVWDFKNKTGKIFVEAHSDSLWTAEFSPDDKILASGSEDGTLVITDVATGSQVGTKIKHPSSVLSLAFSPSGHELVTGCADCKLRLWKIDAEKGIDPNQKPRVLTTHKDFIWDISYSPDGKKIVTASADKTAQIWNAEDWTLLGVLNGHKGEIGSARFSADGQTIVTGSDDCTLRLWDATTLKHVRTLEGNTNVVWRAIFTPDSKRIVNCSYDGKVLVWDLESGELLREIDAHSNQIAGLAITKDGSRIVTASDDQTVKIWELETGVELFVLHDQQVSPNIHASFSSDGNKLVIGNGEGQLTIWTAESAGKGDTTFLPNDSVKVAIEGLKVATNQRSTKEELQAELKSVRFWNTRYPSYALSTIVGVCEYRLGFYSQATATLSEAYRLQRITYDEPDLRPNIEAYLAMSHLRCGNDEQAYKMGDLFMKKSIRWQDDPQVIKLQERLEHIFQNKDHVFSSEFSKPEFQSSSNSELAD